MKVWAQCGPFSNIFLYLIIYLFVVSFIYFIKIVTNQHPQVFYWFCFPLQFICLSRSALFTIYIQPLGHTTKKHRRFYCWQLALSWNWNYTTCILSQEINELMDRNIQQQRQKSFPLQGGTLTRLHLKILFIKVMDKIGDQAEHC